MTCNYSSEEYMGTDSFELCGLGSEKQSVMLYMETWSIDATFNTPSQFSWHTCICGPFQILKKVILFNIVHFFK